MKSMKKALAATLAFTLVFSHLCLASAAYSDQDSIQQTQAVEALTELGILNGKSDGSFDPDGSVTRGEMSKMIYVMNTGSSDASAYNALSTTFQDIDTIWAAPYIKYAAKENILAGRSATVFDPNATVTGLEEAKMLLVCLDYDPDKNGLTGANWAEQAQKLGQTAGLFAGISADITQAMTREDSARMMYNAIQSKNQEKPDSKPNTDDWDSGKISRNEDKCMAGMVVSSYLAQNSDGSKRVFLDILTTDGRKKNVETDLSATSAGATILKAGSLISFWGENYQTIESLRSYNYETKLTDTCNYAAIKSFNEDTGRISFYNGLYNGSVKTNLTAAKITDDTLVIYVDQSDSNAERWKVLEDGSLSQADSANNGYIANAFVALNPSNPSEIELLVVEINNEILNDQEESVILTSDAED